MKILNKRFILITISISLLLSVPLIAMQFTKQFKWSLSDFVLMEGLLLSVGITIELIFRSVKKKSFRIIGAAVVLLIFFLAWAELAVGILGSPFAGS